MSTNNNHSSVSFVKNVAQHNRNFLNANISQLNTININNSSTSNMNHTSSANSTSASSSTNHHHHPHHNHSSSSSNGKNDNANSNSTPNNNNSSSSNIINASLPTNTGIVARKQAHKSISLSNSLGNNGNNAYLYSSGNSMNNSSSQPYFPSMLKSHNQSSFSNINLNSSNKKFSIDYHHAGKHIKYFLKIIIIILNLFFFSYFLQISSI